MPQDGQSQVRQRYELTTKVANLSIRAFAASAGHQRTRARVAPRFGKELSMKKMILCCVLTTGLMAGATSVAHAAKAKKQESEVDKALKQAYPDAETKVTGSSDVNGVKVYDVS